MFSFFTSKRKRFEENLIDVLPDEILHTVFNYLEPNSVKAVSLVNKR